MTGPVPETSSTVDAPVPWTDLIRFVRQLNHDLRNHLNAAELQSAYVNELATDPETKSEIKRLREMISELGKVLQSLSASLGQIKPTLIPYRAADLMEDLRSKVTNDFPKQGATVNWEIQLAEKNLEVDPQLLQQAFVELFANAFLHEPTGGTLRVAAEIENNRLVISLHEPKTHFDLSTGNWGREPLRKITQNHYGLGLNRVRVIVEAHGGEIRAQYDPTASTLVTTIMLPLSGAQS